MLSLEEADALVMAHLRLVDRIAQQVWALVRPSNRWTKCETTFEDLQAAGRLGLVQASRRFHADRGAQFGTFASARIRGAIIDALRARRSGFSPTSGPVARARYVEEPLETATRIAYAGPTPEQRTVTVLLSRRACVRARQFAPRERTILRAFVRGDRRSATARRLGVSESRVLQLQREAFQKLRACLFCAA